jgi:serine/threonine-protein kinase
VRHPGETFGHYTIEALLGEGGMGEVYRAFDTKLHRRVALKLLLTTDASSAADTAARQDATARIIREARVAAALEHPNKVSVFELGEVLGTPYLAMEYIAGSTLRAFVGDGSIGWVRKLGWLLDVARALDAAHAAGLVHRDIKPDNVMVREDGVVKVLDFGIARRADASDDAVDPVAPTAAPGIAMLTGAGVIIGTAAYMPPEQMQGKELDGRADQFSWAVLAFELLSGARPWLATGDTLALVGRMLTQPPAPLGGVPEVVASAVARALSPRREDRFPRMRDLVELLAPIAGQPAPSAPARASHVIGDRVTIDEALAPTHASEAKPTFVARKPAPARGWLLGVASAVLIAGGAGVAFRRWQTPATSVEHCLEVVTTKRGPECRVIVAAGTMDQRGRTYRVTKGAHGVMAVERLNSAGLALGDAGETVRSEVRRGPDGEVLEIVDRDQDGEESSHEVWTEGGARVDFVEADGRTPRHGSGKITRVLREFDPRGYPRRERFLGATGKPRRDEHGVFGRTIEHRADGYVTRMNYEDAAGEPMAETRGFSRVELEADPRGVDREVRTYGLDGLPTSVDGVAIVRVQHSDALDRAAYFYFDAAGRKVANLSTGTHGSSAERRVDPRRVTWINVDEDGRPREQKGDASASVELYFDERGRVRETRYLDAAGNPVITKLMGAAGYAETWDARDHAVEMRLLGPDGHPMVAEGGFARTTRGFGSTGRPVERRYFDEADRPTPSMGSAGPLNRFTYDDRGLPTEHASRDEGDHPFATADGSASTRWKYDRLRNEVEEAYFDAEGKAVVSSSGFAARRSRYDADDDLVSISYSDAEGAPTFHTGFATKHLKYDDRGLVVEESYFDTNDNPVLLSDGYATVRYARDRSGDVTAESYLGRRGEPVLCAGGYARKTNTYEVHRRRATTALFDTSGAPVLGSAGWSVERLTYDDRGLVVREDHLDAVGQPKVTKAGAASIVRKWDKRGNLEEEASLGPDGRPIVLPGGYAITRYGYDERDRLVGEARLGADGAPVAGAGGWSSRRLRYDELGDPVEESFFDREHKPVVAKEPGYASKRDKYDARRRLVETVYLDPAGVPAPGPDGAEIVRFKRDAYGRAIEVAYFDATAEPRRAKGGASVVQSSYDTSGHLTEERFLDASGAPVTAADGCASHRTSYDAQGREVERSCRDAAGRPTVGSDGWAVKKSIRDAHGSVVDEATYGASGALRADSSGVARRKNRYDERSLLQETTFFGATDRPTKDNGGAVAIRFLYDEAGKLLAETRVGVDGREVARPRTGGRSGG